MAQNTIQHTRLLYMRAVVLMLSALCVVAFVSHAHAGRSSTTCDTMRLCVAFLDVGQGDAIYIRSPSGTSMLIDGGRDGSVIRELSQAMPKGENTLTYVVATHPDLDHIGGLAAVVERYTPQKILTITSDKLTDATQQLEQMIIDKNVNRVVASSGDVYDLGSGVSAEVLYPFRDIETDDTNEESIVMLVTYGDSRFLLTADAPMNTEHEMVHVYGDALRADVLKAGHHGSKTSSSGYFLAAVQPTLAIISAGKDNSYGHPHEEAVARLQDGGAQLLSTAQNGSIIMESDAQKITVRRR